MDYGGKEQNQKMSTTEDSVMKKEKNAFSKIVLPVPKIVRSDITT